MPYPDEAGHHLEVINFTPGYGALQMREERAASPPRSWRGTRPGIEAGPRRRPRGTTCSAPSSSPRANTTCRSSMALERHGIPRLMCRRPHAAVDRPLAALTRRELPCRPSDFELIAGC